MHQAVELPMLGIEAPEVIDGGQQGEEGAEDDDEADGARVRVDPDVVWKANEGSACSIEAQAKAPATTVPSRPMKLIAVLSEERSVLVLSVCESPRLKQSSINRSVPVAMKTRAGRIAWKSLAETSPEEASAAALWPRVSFDCRNVVMWSIVSLS